MAPLGELEEGDGFETNASFDDQCAIIVELEDTFSDEHSLDEPCIMDFSAVTPPNELIHPIYVQTSVEFAPILPISSLSSSLPILLPSLDPSEFDFAECETSMLGNNCLS